MFGYSFKRCLSIFYYNGKTFYQNRWIIWHTATTKVSTLMFQHCQQIPWNNTITPKKKLLDNNRIKREIKIVKCNNVHNWGIIHCYLVFMPAISRDTLTYVEYAPCQIIQSHNFQKRWTWFKKLLVEATTVR